MFHSIFWQGSYETWVSNKIHIKATEEKLFKKVYFCFVNSVIVPSKKDLPKNLIVDTTM